jgi:hypothetical protein
VVSRWSRRRSCSNELRIEWKAQLSILDDQVVVAPQEVDFVAFDADLRLGLGQAGSADQAEGDALEV